MKKSIFLGFFPLMLFLVGFLYAPDKKLSIHLKKVRDIGTDRKGELYRWIDIAFDKKNNLYVTDMLDYSIKKYDFKGNFIKKTGQRGNGPGEFLSPGLIVYHNRKLYVTQQMFPGIQVFDTMLNYLYTIKINIPIWDLKFDANGRMYILSVTISGPYNNNIMNIKDSYTTNLKLKPNNNNKNKFLDFANFDIDKQGNFIKVFNGKNIIVKYNSLGKVLWEKHLPFLKKGAKKEIGEKPFTIFSDFIYKAISIDNKGMLYILGGNSKDIYVLDKEGNYLTTVRLSDYTHTIKIRNGYLFTREKEGEQIGVFKIIKN